MYKEKYKAEGQIDLMLDSMLSIVDFMRTPFSVLESQAKADLKGTSGIDLQWGTMLKGFEQTMKNILEMKKGDKTSANTDFENWGNDKALIQACYGVENERNKAAKTIHELTAALAELKSKSNINATVLEKMVVALGYAGKEPGEVLSKLEPYIHELKEPLNLQIPTPITDIISKRIAQWEEAYTEIETQLEQVKVLNGEYFSTLTSVQAENSTQAELLAARNQEIGTLQSTLTLSEAALEQALSTNSELSAHLLEARTQLEKASLSIEASRSTLTSVHAETSTQAELPVENMEHKNLVAAKEPHLAQASSPNADLLKEKNMLCLRLGRIHNLQSEQVTGIFKEIEDCANTSEVTKKIQSLEQISRVLENIQSGILKRNGWSSSDPNLKCEAIKEAFNQLSVNDKIALTNFNEKNLKEEVEYEDKANVTKFIEAVKQNRGIGGAFGVEATSFKDFKKIIQSNREEKNQSVGMLTKTK